MISRKSTLISSLLLLLAISLFACLASENGSFVHQSGSPETGHDETPGTGGDGGNDDEGDVNDDTPAVTPAPGTYRLPEVTIEARTPVRNDVLLNAEATVPPQCYTKTEGRHNPCYTCHQLYDRQQGEDRLNQLDDGSLQGGYAFSDIGVTNHWINLFQDRNAWLASISDNDILNYINTENYTKLAGKLAQAGWKGFVPDLKDYHLSAQAFDDKGLALDGSHWVAFNYKPFPGTFWPTNGSTDDVIIRLPKAFREKDGQFNRDVYFINLTLAELNIKNQSEMPLWPIDETLIGQDINGDSLLKTTPVIRKGSHYVGDASAVALEFQQFPTGTEFMHSVRYVGVNEGNIVVPARMKELRYMKKVNVLPRHEIEGRYANERKEKLLGELPSFLNMEDEGFDNSLGWYVQGFIEDYDGELRPQTFEERLFCMGCHNAIGTTIDSTFSFARKVDGGSGWGYINLHGMKDAPSLAEPGGEILNYLKRSGGGNELRENTEMLARWYNPDGTVREDAVRQADVYTLLAPSVERAIKLNKAYTHIVRHQSFIYGRDANWQPAVNLYTDIDEDIPPMESEHRYYGWDIRLGW